MIIGAPLSDLITIEASKIWGKVFLSQKIFTWVMYILYKYYLFIINALLLVLGTYYSDLFQPKGQIQKCGGIETKFTF